MRFRSIRYSSFRNIRNRELLCDSDNIILKGINGQGKTNVLESVYVLSYGSSFRTSNIREMIRSGEDEMHLSAEVLTDDGDSSYIDYYIKDRKRRILLNGKEIKDRKELIYNFPCIVFSHEDIDFIKGEPENRRRFFDQTFSMYDPLYLDDCRRYRLILNQRNAAIKNGQISLLSLYNERLARYGLQIMEKRTRGIYEFNQIFPVLYSRISGTDKHIDIKYSPSWSSFTSVEEIVQYLESTQERDMKLCTTSSGIHRDKYIVEDEMGPFIQTGSTGQIRLASLLFRVAEERFFIQKTGKKPILLIDDVLLELDSDKRAAFLNELSDYSQAFYTFLPRENYFSERKESLIEYEVKEGDFEEVGI